MEVVLGSKLPLKFGWQAFPPGILLYLLAMERWESCNGTAVPPLHSPQLFG